MGIGMLSPPFIATVYRYERINGSTIPLFDINAQEMSPEEGAVFICGFLDTLVYREMEKALIDCGMFLVEYRDVEIVKVLPSGKVIFKNVL